MKNCLFIFIALLLFYPLSQAQNDIKVMSYNVLTFPEGAGAINRQDTLKKILDYHTPDLFLIQELKSEVGLDLLLDQFDDLGNYERGTYVEQISNPQNTWRLQQNLIYNTDLFELVDEEALTTTYRDINYFKLAIIDTDITQVLEDTLLHIYISHLKSSWGEENEQLRLAMAETWIDYIEELPPNSKIIAAGDFNVYSGDEPAYEWLTGDHGSNSLHDPIDMPDWDDVNFSNLEVYTQSTREDSPGNGAGGGMDDRFDFVLLSNSLMGLTDNIEDTTSLVYIEDTYKAFGNNGICYNENITDCSSNNEVPFGILSALFHMSDHLPVVLDLGLSDSISMTDTMIVDTTINDTMLFTPLLATQVPLIKLSPNPTQHHTQVEWTGNLPARLQIFDLNGLLLQEDILHQNNYLLNVENWNRGVYLVKVFDKELERYFVEKLMVY